MYILEIVGRASMLVIIIIAYGFTMCVMERYKIFNNEDDEEE